MFARIFGFNMIFNLTAYSALATIKFVISHLQGTTDWMVIAVGVIVSFISALILIRVLVAYVAKRDFMIFAWYRIGSGLIILLFALTGWKLW